MDENSNSEKKEGMYLSRDSNKYGITRQTLASWAREGKLERVGRGVYLAPDEMDDTMFKIQVRCHNAVFSHETALYCHGLSDRVPLTYSMTVPSGKNVSHMRNENIQFFYVKSELYELGMTEGKSIYGNPIRLYSAERALCDVLRNRKKMDNSIFICALRAYMMEKPNIPLLLRIAGAFHMENIMRPYLEVLA